MTSLQGAVGHRRESRYSLGPWRLRFWRLLLTVALLEGLPALAEVMETESAELEQRLVTVQDRLKGLMTGPSGLTGLDERSSAAVRYQQDRRILALVGAYDRLSAEVAAYPETAQKTLLARQLTSIGQQLVALVTKRVTLLDANIDAQQTHSLTLTGAEQLAEIALTQTLIRQWLQYLEAMIDLAEAGDGFDEPAESLRALAAERLQAFADAQAGILLYHGNAQERLVQALGARPDEADLSVAVATQQALLIEAKRHLEQAINQLERLNIGTAEYRRILTTQSTGVSVSLVDGDSLFEWLDEMLSQGRAWWNHHALDGLFRLLIFAGIVLLAKLVATLAKATLARALSSRGEGMSVLLKDVLVSMTGGGVFALGILVALAQLGLSVAPMIAGLGVAGFIIGFALQDVLGNFAAGAMILMYRPFDTGDYIDVAGVQGTVKHMNMVSTTIATPDNQTLIVPNSKIWGDVIRNYTGQRTRRIDLEFGVSYGDSIERVEAILADIIAHTPEVLPEPVPVIRVHRLGESSVDFIVRPWVRTEHYWDVYWRLQRQVKLRFDAEGICIPFPQRDVHHYYEGAVPKVEVNTLDVD